MIMCDPRAKVRCPFKNSCCGDETAYFVEGSECDEFNQIILAPPPTNADLIRSMSDAELAVAIAEHTCTGACNDFGITVNVKCCRDCTKCTGIIDWLQQPAEEG
jgi:hypothetical protein